MQLFPEFLSERSSGRALCFAAFIAFAFACVPCLAQRRNLTVPTSMPMAVQLVKHVPMKKGQPLAGRLLYPVYVDNQLAIPAGSRLEGKIVSLVPDKHRRLEGKLQGDFTPFWKPVVAFREISFPGGEHFAVSSDEARDGAPILHLTAATPHTKRAFIRAQFDQAKQQAKDEIGLITQPGRGDRILQFLYRQLPYHPQRLETGTEWTVNLAMPLEVPVEADPPSQAAPMDVAAKQAAPRNSSEASDPDTTLLKAHPGAELLHAYLTTTISSATAKPGDEFRACITEPVYDARHHLAVPEGAVLIGTVTQAKPAKSFGRKGQLRFSFRELQLPGGGQKNVDGMLAGADASKGAHLQIDAEGGVQPKPPNRAVVPLALSVLASKALDSDGSQAANGTVASNGFGIVGRITGIVSGPRAIAAGIGFYGAGLSVFNRWIATGTNVTFVKDTRIDVLTRPARARLAASGPTPQS